MGEDEGGVPGGGALPFAEGFLSVEGAGAFGLLGVVFGFFGGLPFCVVVDGLVCCGGEDQAEVSQCGFGKGDGHSIYVEFVLKQTEGGVGRAVPRG